MKTLIFGTTNPAKVAQLQGALAPININVEAIDKNAVPEVEEDGATVQENARKKATIYAKAINQTVFSMDNALFLDGLKPEEQPGIHVRRIGGTYAATDQELLDHARALVETIGNETTGYWEYGICIAKPDGTVSETTIRTPRTFTSKASSKMIQGYPLESIQINPETGKYISEMTEEEKADFWQKTLGVQLATFVQEVMKNS